MEALSYSLHLGSDKNKKNSSKARAKLNLSGTTSKSNNAIQNAQTLSKVNNHNLRKYDNNTELINVIVGTNDLEKDVKQLYLDEFEEARKNYNDNQIRSDRKIDNYFNHISNNSNRDLACELIIELGDMDFWKDKSLEYKCKMTSVFTDQISDLRKILPQFKIANATIHYDESSPHLHIVGVPVKEGYKNGMKKQVGKSLIFTKDSLRQIQDKMRIYCINSFNKHYEVEYELKEKQKGNNQDIPSYMMKDYKKMKKEKEKYQQKITDIDNKVNDLNYKSDNIINLINNIKGKKSKYVLTEETINNIKDYILDVRKTTNKINKNTNVNAFISVCEDYIIDNTTKIDDLENTISNKDIEIKLLQKEINLKDKVIKELKANIEEIKNQLVVFKNFWKNIIKFFQTKVLIKKDKMYQDIVNELKDKNIITEEEKNNIELGIPIKNKIEKEKDNIFRN